METKEPIKFDMIDYIAKNSTMYDLMDKYLGGYLNGDFSTISLINHCRTFDDDFKSSSPSKFYAYKSILKPLVTNLLQALKSEKLPEDGSIKKALTDEEKAELLARLQDIDPNRSITSIEEAISLLNNNFSEEYYANIDFYSKLNSIITEAALDVCSDKALLDIRQMVLKFGFLPHISNELKAKYPNRAVEYVPEWEEFDFISRTLTNIEKLQRYDEILRERDEKINRSEEKIVTEIFCTFKRERFVIEKLVEGMTDDEKDKVARTGCIEDVLFEKPTISPKQGSHIWYIDLYSDPRLLMDKIAKYSESGKENERVIVISYGRFGYDSMFNGEGKPSMSGEAMDFLGVTRIGADGIKNNFVLAPISQCAFTKTIVAESNDREIRGAIGSLDENNILQEWNLSRTSLIPEELEAFYATVAFSTEYMQAAIKENFRYIGEVFGGTKPRVNATYRANANDLEAVAYASKFSGVIGDITVKSLDQFCQAPQVLARHLEVINDFGINTKIKPREYHEIARGRDIVALKARQPRRSKKIDDSNVIITKRKRDLSTEEGTR